MESRRSFIQLPRMKNKRVERALKNIAAKKESIEKVLNGFHVFFELVAFMCSIVHSCQHNTCNFESTRLFAFSVSIIAIVWHILIVIQERHEINLTLFYLSSCFILFRPVLLAASASRVSKRLRLLSGLLFIILFLRRHGFLREARR